MMTGLWKFVALTYIVLEKEWIKHYKQTLSKVGELRQDGLMRF